VTRLKSWPATKTKGHFVNELQTQDTSNDFHFGLSCGSLFSGPHPPERSMIGRHLYPAVLAPLLGAGLHAQAGPHCQVVPKSMAAMRGCYRPLLVFSPSATDGRLRRQSVLLDAAADDMMDRFVLFTPVVQDEARVNPPRDAPYTKLPEPEVSAVRQRYEISAGTFAVVLLDEDGTVRLRSENPVSADRLNGVIDRTARRQAEMQRPHAN
jgi:Domain of unknown function (DUF4174)